MTNEDMMRRIESSIAVLEQIEMDMDTSDEEEDFGRFNVELAIRNLLQITQY